MHGLRVLCGLGRDLAAAKCADNEFVALVGARVDASPGRFLGVCLNGTLMRESAHMATRAKCTPCDALAAETAKCGGQPGGQEGCMCH